MSERLEEIKEEVELLRDDMCVTSIEVDTSADSILDDMEWLIEQAEQNQHYRNLLESLNNTHNIASEIMKEQPDKKIINANDLLQYILRKINDELEREDNE